MAIYKAQISVATDTALPKDRMVMTPHFKVTGPADPQQLAVDLAAGISAWLKNATYDVNVKLYDDEESPTGPPKGEHQIGTQSVSSQAPREIALCLSFWAGTSTKRRRGRLYVPHTFIYRAASSATQVGIRPTLADQNAVKALVTIFEGLGGLNVDWVVWSKADQAARTVTNWYVDDEWDIQRRRGGRPTSRIAGTTSG